jgi:hypothetical protein
MQPEKKGFEFCQSTSFSPFKNIKGAYMPEYNVSIVHTIRIVGVATVRAESEEATLAKMQQRADEGHLGRVEWHIEEDQSGGDERYEQEVHLTIETVTED